MLRVLLIILVMGSAKGCYVLDQAFTQNSLLNSRRALSEVIQDDKVDDELKASLKEAQEIISYAHKNGLTGAGAYEHFVALEGDAISYVVSAAPPLSLEPYTWWFPIVGEVPYLGFFNEPDRDDKANELKEQGLDVATGQVGAFSSLGWFEDPLYSSMLRRDPTSLAHLLFHELTHRTFWSQGSVRFNENLAEFVALNLTKKYLIDGGRHEDLEAYKDRRQDKLLYIEWVQGLKDELEALYQANISDEEKLQKKKAVFQRFLTTEYPSFKSNGYQRIKNREWNNARVMAASLYSPKLEEFERALSCLQPQTIGEFLDELALLEEEHGEPFLALNHMCQGGKE